MDLSIHGNYGFINSMDFYVSSMDFTYFYGFHKFLKIPWIFHGIYGFSMESMEFLWISWNLWKIHEIHEKSMEFHKIHGIYGIHGFCQMIHSHS
jgi:hypothetical protein